MNKLIVAISGAKYSGKDTIGTVIYAFLHKLATKYPDIDKATDNITCIAYADSLREMAEWYLSEVYNCNAQEIAEFMASREIIHPKFHLTYNELLCTLGDMFLAIDPLTLIQKVHHTCDTSSITIITDVRTKEEIDLLRCRYKDNLIHVHIGKKSTLELCMAKFHRTWLVKLLGRKLHRTEQDQVYLASICNYYLHNRNLNKEWDNRASNSVLIKELPVLSEILYDCASRIGASDFISFRKEFPNILDAWNHLIDISVANTFATKFKPLVLTPKPTKAITPKPDWIDNPTTTTTLEKLATMEDQALKGIHISAVPVPEWTSKDTNPTILEQHAFGMDKAGNKLATSEEFTIEDVLAAARELYDSTITYAEALKEQGEVNTPEGVKKIDILSKEEIESVSYMIGENIDAIPTPEELKKIVDAEDDEVLPKLTLPKLDI